MSATDQLREELEKAASLVTTARRLLDTGTMVDLSALEGKVRAVCASVGGMKREDGRPLMAVMEALIADLDRLDESIQERYLPLVDRLGPLEPG